MAWSKRQKSSFAICAAEVAGRNGQDPDAIRKLLLAQLDKRAHHQGRITSTSPKLTHTDFDWVMACLERSAGGKLKAYTRGYWSAQADDGCSRMRRIARRFADQLERQRLATLNGIVDRCRLEVQEVERMDYPDLNAVIGAMRAIARRNGVRLT